VSFKHYTLTFNVKAAGLMDLSVEEPIAEVAMRHGLLDQPEDKKSQRRGRAAMFDDCARLMGSDLRA
jgi:hypothetical protein